MRLNILWRIMEIEEGVIRRGRRPRRITHHISIIPHMIRKPNSIIVYYSFKIISSLKAWLKHVYFHRSIAVKFIFDSAHLRLFSASKYSPNSRCRPSSCLLAVLAMFLAIISPSCYSWNEWNVRHFVFTTKTTQPRLQVFSVNGTLTCKKAAHLKSSVH